MKNLITILQPAVIATGLLCLLCGVAVAQGSGTLPSAGAQQRIEAFTLRYDKLGWPGKSGPVTAGIRPELLGVKDGAAKEGTGETAPVPDHDRWLDVDGERVLLRRFTFPGSATALEIAVTRTCRAAQEVLFRHLARPRSAAPLEPPALPFGEERSNRLGDVGFTLPWDREGGLFEAAFVRSNVAVFLTADSDKGAERLEAIAKGIDAVLASQQRFPDWRSSGRWPAIQRIDGLPARIKAGALVPLKITAVGPAGEPLTTAWELTAGGIIEKTDGPHYYAEGAGPQSLTLLMADGRGLAHSIRLEFEIIP